MSCLFWRLNSTWCHCNDAIFWHQFFCEIKFNGCNSLSRHNMFLRFLVQPCRACTETVRDQSFFCFEEMDQSLPTTEDGTARFLEILDSVRSAEVPNSNLMLLISKHAFSDRFNISFISYEPFHFSSEKMSTSYLIQLFTCWFQVSQWPLQLWAIDFQVFVLTFL